MATPASAAPGCRQWRVGQYFRAVQSNGYTVTFQLVQDDRGRLTGRAFYQASRGKVVYGRATGGVGERNIQMQVTWENWAVGNYYGAAFGTKPSGGYLWANIRGNNFPEGGGDSASWYTNHGTGESKPLSCPPADVIAG